ncbi:bifunctional 3-(3-hydroxy-phenyl)propionate/3-hydroxycinnamic acid hydroxylase [Bacillus sp. SD075]|uniref:bifunctional 3-(3-hydroxy-phenyl)propionate/3-hydroxycinnamic acid hydroxylase MhpA n=1 Tax=Bacillus sp. SD075 TaxID=2781732 RepID=UPI001A9792D0|nr:bifunctional 3-(3-hydroxy-phenyl)propionate/3-hydroxycinnamic acid hydroxylase [Bacillus sp. SD075]MBO1000654.1 bifunctional 3-(3-hydroxy-phenyl)propionate/3-hydroxycinnamic acid hydroxylase [Bacillus sp. SD075]
MKKENLDVAIVGYGPSGKLLATLLGQQGWKVGVYERFPEPFTLPRAVHYDHEIARILQAILPTSEIERISEKVPDFYEWCNADRQALLKIDWSEFGISGWSRDMFFNQPELEKVMDAACRNQFTISIHLGYEAVGLTEYEDRVDLVVKNLQGVQTSVTARYVIGCDGANSFVRQQMEHTVTDLGFQSDWLVVDIIPLEDREWKPSNLQLCDPARPTTIVSGGPGRRRWEFMTLPGETKEQLNHEEVAWRLLEPWNISPDNAILERHAVYTFKAMWVNEWRKGRLMIAGDAAHLTPPFMGQGLCSGLRDSKNLAWKLDLVLSGEVDDSILDTYTSERKPHTQAVIEAALYLGKMICVTDPQAAKERDEAFLSGNAPEFPEFPILTDGILFQNGEEASETYAGQLSLQSEVTYRGKTGLLDDIVGQGWTVLSLVDDPRVVLSTEEIEFIEELDAKFIRIYPKQETSWDAVVDVQGKYEQYFKETGFKAVIVRPDYYIFGAVSTLDQLPSIIEDLSNQIKNKNTDTTRYITQ